MEPTSLAASPHGTLGNRAQTGHFFLINFAGKTFKRLYRSRYGKVLMVLFLLAVVASATASVYVYNYVSGTAAVQTPDVRLVAGPDVGSSACTSYPCASGTVTNYNFMTVTLSLFASAVASPEPATYYSNFAQITNAAASGSHNILSVQLINVAGNTYLGAVTVYYCTAQTEFNAAGTLVTPGNCPYSFTITSSSGATGSIFSGTDGLLHGTSRYIEILAYAGSGVSSGSVTFDIAVEWV